MSGSSHGLQRDATSLLASGAFEHQCKRAGISPPRHYPPGVSGDRVTTKGIAYPRSTSAAGMRDGHGTVYVDTRNDVLLR